MSLHDCSLVESATGIEPELEESLYFGLKTDEIELLPLMAWAEPIIVRQRCRVRNVIDALSLRLPENIDAHSLSASINAAFVKTLLHWSKRSLVLLLGALRNANELEGETPTARFQYFLSMLQDADMCAYIDQQFPLLRPGAVLRARQTARSLIRVLRRIARDKEALRIFSNQHPSLGRLKHVETQMGDLHAGESVSRLWFENGRIYYKPRSMGMDVAFSRFLTRLNAQGVRPTQYAMRALDCGNYGYVEEIQFHDVNNEQELREYYQRIGGMLAIGLIINATDLHYENLIASGAYPVIIDVESLFCPSETSRRKKIQLRGANEETVLHSCLLPYGSHEKHPLETSGLFAPPATIQQLIPVDAGTDALRLRISHVPSPRGANTPSLPGTLISPGDYSEDICNGFKETYSGLMRHKAELLQDNGPLAEFKTLRIRAVLRPTQVYTYLLQALSHPEYQSSLDASNALIDRIRPKQDDAGIKTLTWEAERTALLRGDVPYFSTSANSLDVYDEHQNLIPHFHASSGWSESRESLRRLSEADNARQCRLIQQAILGKQLDDDKYESLHGTTSANSANRSIDFNPDDFVAEAIRIGDHILHCGFTEALPHRYFQLQVQNNQKHRVFQLGNDLYQGLAGLAIYFAELHKLTGLERFQQATEGILDSVRSCGREFNSIDAYSGIAGWIYTLAFIGSRWNRQDLLEEAASHLSKFAGKIEQDKVFDVIGGVAGILTVMIALEHQLPGYGAMAIAQQCAQHLCANAIVDEHGAYWPNAADPGAALTGFSHGASGIAMALGRYGMLKNDKGSLDLARAALRFERSTIDPERGEWPDLRPHGCSKHGHQSFPYAWCHGAPGIGLARLAMPHGLRDSDWHQDIEQAVKLTKMHGFHGSHCLCHGQLGNLELLIQYAQQFPTNENILAWQDAAVSLLTEGRGTWQPGPVPQYDALGLMNGLAGIGYGLLRVAAPKQTPATLLLEITPA